MQKVATMVLDINDDDGFKAVMDEHSLIVSRNNYAK
jgi:hypothetical protein